MEYKKLRNYLSRKSFKSKMMISFLESCKFVGLENGPKNLEKGFNPWMVETFTLLSIMANEWKNDGFKENELSKIYKAIHNGIDNDVDINKGFKVLEKYYTQQFDIQENQFIKMYRMNYFFNFKNSKIDMTSVFKNAFGFSYEVIINYYNQLAMILSVLYENLNSSILIELLGKYIFEQNELITNIFSIERESFTNKMTKITQNEQDYLYCANPLYSYPFIKYEEITYLPVPHLLLRACTYSLLYRLTENNNELRTIIGKEVMENYVYNLLVESGCYNYVSSEVEFKYKKNSIRSCDSFCIDGNKMLLCECKLTVPSNQYRLLNLERRNDDIKQLCENLNQLYKQLKCYSELYDCGRIKQKTEISNKYGILILFENLYIDREELINRFLEEHKIDETEHVWVKTNLKVVDLHYLEKMTITKNSIIDDLVKINLNEWNYYLTADSYSSDNPITSFVNFKRNRIKSIDELIENIKKDRNC